MDLAGLQVSQAQSQMPCLSTNFSLHTLLALGLLCMAHGDPHHVAHADKARQKLDLPGAE